jgi:hypothetical protein
MSFEVKQISWKDERGGGWNIYLRRFHEIHRSQQEVSIHHIRIQYLLSVRLKVAFQPTRLKFLLSFRKSLGPKMKRGRQLDFDDETEGRWGGGGRFDAVGRRCLT